MQKCEIVFDRRARGQGGKRVNTYAHQLKDYVPSQRALGDLGIGALGLGLSNGVYRNQWDIGAMEHWGKTPTSQYLLHNGKHQS